MDRQVFKGGELFHRGEGTGKATRDIKSEIISMIKTLGAMSIGQVRQCDTEGY